MKFVNVTAECGKEELLAALRDSGQTNKNVKFEEKRGRPVMFLKEKRKSITISCKYVGGASRDNGFIVGTYFLGKIKEKADGCKVRGVVWTAPIFHAALLCMLIAFVIQCIYLKGFSVIPLCAIAFDVVLFWNEFAKQGIISRYIGRAARRAEKEK